MKTKTLTTLHLRNSISPECFRGYLLIPLLFGCFALSLTAKAQCPSLCDSSNTALGESALAHNTGTYNTSNGAAALYSNTSGGSNTADGYAALVSNKTGGANTAIGFEALLVNNGSRNTATGDGALSGNTTGSNNTANGYQALASNTSGNDNTANGYQALFNSKNTTGFANTANGYQALYKNTTGGSNTANGWQALYKNTTGSNNTADGDSALLNSIGSNNIALGASAGQSLTSGSNNIDIGNEGVAGESGIIRVGVEGSQTHTFIAGIYGETVTGTAVVVNSNGRLGVPPSSARFKDQIKPMDKASEAILDLKPVTFHYKHELDPDGIPQFGLVAEQVEKVNPDLVVRDAKGEVYSVRYEAVNAMLLNEFLKEHKAFLKEQRKVENIENDFQVTVAQQKKEIAALTVTVKEQASQIQKVSARLEATKPAPQVVNNP